MLILVPYCKYKQFSSQISRVLLQKLSICSNDVLTIHQQAHDHVFACLNSLPHNASDLRKVVIWAVLQDQLEQLIKRVGVILLTLFYLYVVTAVFIHA